MLQKHIDSFFNHLNEQHPRIKFTVEYEEKRSLPYLDTRVTVNPNGNVETSVYRKKTHTNQYLDFNSNHHVKQKVGIISTLMKRVEIITKEEDKIEEQEIVKDAFRACGYPEWVVNINHKKKKEKKEKDQFLGRVSIPYNKGLSE